MKFNFKKVVSVLATTAMLGSTVAFAAAAYPAPFVSSGAADAAIVYGSTAAATDMAAATDLMNSLNAGVTATGSTTVGGVGDKILLGSKTSATKLNLGDGIATVQGTSITSDDLPGMLASGSFYNKQNNEYKYTQKIELGNLTFSQNQDSSFLNKAPYLGFKISSGNYIANYTLAFDTSPESAQSSDNSLTDLENKNIAFLGKNYYVLDFKNSSSSGGKLTLLDAATSATLSEGESKTITVGDKTYNVSINFISTGQVVLTVNGVNTEKLSDDGISYGNTFKLADGTYIGVKTINVQNYAGGTKNVEFSIGKGKLELTHTSSIKINDVTEDSITAFFKMSASSNSGKSVWDKLVLQWKANDKQFIAPGTELVMPGFQAVKLTMAETTVPSKEVTTVTYDSDDVIQLETTIKGGDVTIPLLYFSTSTGNVTGIGKSATARLMTTNGSTLVFNATDSDNRFVASWTNGKDAESYYLAANVRTDSGNGKNYVKVTDKLTGAEKEVESNSTTEQVTFGNVVLTVTASTRTGDGVKSATLVAASGTTFNTLYTKGGMKVYLPFSAITSESSKGALLIANATDASTSAVLWLSEADKNGNLAQKDFSLTLRTSGSTPKATVYSVSGAGTALETATSSKLWESYVVSDLATKIVQDKTSSDQYSATVEYHAGEVYANVYVAAPSVTASSTVKVQVFKDTEAATAAKDKNLIVVGGSCINTLAQMIVDAAATAPICGADFSAKTSVGVGQYLIKVAASPLNAGKVAMLVAGYEAADTTAAVAKVKEGSVDTSKMGSTVYPIATA